ncbi:poly-gamma-glutamate hydrolase family protein [Halorarius litoreus]|uniref:poly-gamma-glutamate hydrolase family protein n=1 Tax=Halorarius litoreus TaxID=2962676 RepID=UPI0020CE224C|nr:poly-gamma-glutamate hydrolase family protein [Halorarius litoreus]
MNSTSRRTVLQTTGALVAAGTLPTAALAKPGSGKGNGGETGGSDGGDSASVTVADSVSSAAHCGLPAAVRSAVGVAVGHQLRLWVDGTCAVYTVEHTDERTVVVSRAGARRLGVGGKRFRATLDPQVIHPTYDLATAEREGEFVERLVGGGDVVACAPHGGYIEYGTDLQARRVADRLGATAWYCAGWSPGGGAYDRWHVTSTAIHPASFPALASVADGGFRYAVAFHGWSNDGVGIGGTAPESVLAAVRDAVAAVVDDEPVFLVTAPAYGGTNPDNLVNWLSGGQGIQLEQSRTARTTYGTAIADAVTDVLASA